MDPLRGVAGTADDPLNGVEETEAMRNTGSVPFVQYLTFSKSSKPRPSAPRPSSPPRRTFASSSAAPIVENTECKCSNKVRSDGSSNGFREKDAKEYGQGAGGIERYGDANYGQRDTRNQEEPRVKRATSEKKLHGSSRRTSEFKLGKRGYQ